MGGLEQWARFTALAVVLVVSGALVGWTTPLGEVAPALSRLGRPLRWLRLPVDEWVDRDRAGDPLPAAAHRRGPRCWARPGACGRTTTEVREHPRSAIKQAPRSRRNDLLATAIVASIRRARDLADAIVNRGGLGAGGSLPGRALPVRRRDGAGRDHGVVRR